MIRAANTVKLVVAAMLVAGPSAKRCEPRPAVWTRPATFERNRTSVCRFQRLIRSTSRSTGAE